jgi:hypothetical protein
MVRHPNDFSGQRPDARRKFRALPAFLRKKADFGGDVPDNPRTSTCARAISP